uniref:C2H2-type domain-containing protein n=1 Tax=Neogobius melanostomus TaxID=47308 RepID=A0A8C6S7T4_9GOBI
MQVPTPQDNNFNPVTSYDKTMLPCDQCGKSFLTANSLKTHMQLHTGDQYGKIFADTCDFKSHPEEKTYDCELCDKSLKSSLGLKLHLRNHFGERPYACNQCEKTFVHSAALKSHTRLHTGEKPYKCKQCERCFAHLAGLKSHKVVHTDPGIKPYNCDSCDKAFSRRTSLKLHMESHQEKTFNCKYCEKSFRSRGTLQRHMQNHPKENGTYSYDPCDGSIKTESGMTHYQKHYVFCTYVIPFEASQHPENKLQEQESMQNTSEKQAKCEPELQEAEEKKHLIDLKTEEFDTAIDNVKNEEDDFAIGNLKTEEEDIAIQK